jgi:hypothetical protein
VPLTKGAPSKLPRAGGERKMGRRPERSGASCATCAGHRSIGLVLLSVAAMAYIPFQLATRWVDIPTRRAERLRNSTASVR